MPTSFFFRDTASDIDPSANLDRLLALGVRGGSAVTSVTNTAAGTVGEETALFVTASAGGSILEWYSNPLDAVTISGTVTINLRGLENNAMANASLTCRIDRVSNDGTSFLGNLVAYGAPSVGTELGTVEAARNYTVTPTSQTLSAGDRLRAVVMLDDGSGTTMASGFTVSFFYDGPTGGASGDSFVSFTETITEQGAGVATSPPEIYRYARMRYGRI